MRHQGNANAERDPLVQVLSHDDVCCVYHRTSKLPREIPPLPWYRTTVPQMVMAGFLPFSAIYIELYYIFASIWGHKVRGAGCGVLNTYTHREMRLRQWILLCDPLASTQTVTHLEMLHGMWP